MRPKPNILVQIENRDLATMIVQELLANASWWEDRAACLPKSNAIAIVRSLLDAQAKEGEGEMSVTKSCIPPCCAEHPIIVCEICGDSVCKEHWWKIAGKNTCPDCGSQIEGPSQEK